MRPINEDKFTALVEKIESMEVRQTLGELMRKVNSLITISEDHGDRIGTLEDDMNALSPPPTDMDEDGNVVEK
jgi:hypothetical protein